MQHDIVGIVPARGAAPRLQLPGKIGGRLGAERRIGGPAPFAAKTVAGSAGGKTARRIARHIEPRRRPRRSRARRERQPRIIGRDALALGRVQPRSDVAHLRMPSAPRRIIVQLPLEIAGVEACQPRRARTVAVAVETVAGEAGMLRPGITAAERDQLTGHGEAVRRGPFDRAAAAGERPQEPRNDPDRRSCTCPRHSGGNLLVRPLFRNQNALAIEGCRMGAQ